MDVIEFDKGCYVGTKVKEHAFGSIITTETTFPESFASDWHFHQNPHYSHILSGGSKEIREGEIQVQTQGDGLYYFPGIPHQNIQYLAGTRIFNLEMDKDFFIKHELMIPAEAQMFSDRLKANTTGLLAILKEHRLDEQHSGLAIEHLCVKLVAAASEHIKHYPEWTRKIVDVLNYNLNANLSLVQLAHAVQIHPVTLSKYFSKYFNCTLGEYIRKLKVDKALKMIRTGNFTLTEITYACGFADQSHFTKSFLLFTGMLPKYYRNL